MIEDRYFYFKIPIPKELLSEGNKRDHWYKLHARNRRKDKWLTAYLMKVYPISPNETCAITLTRIAPRKLDDDNWITSCKHFRDWIADRLIPGLKPGIADSDPRLSWKYYQASAKSEYALIIEVEYVKPNPFKDVIISRKCTYPEWGESTN